MKLYFIERNTKSPRIINPVSYDQKNDIYYAFEYEKEKELNTSLKIGVICPKATHVIVKQNDNIIYLERFHNEIWQQPENTWQEGRFRENTDGIFGFNVGGDFYIEAWQGNHLLEKVHIAIIPNVFTLEEYRLMQEEVVQLIETFSLEKNQNEHETTFLKRIQRYLYPIEKLREILNNFTEILEEIIENPSFDLEKVIVKKHKQNIKRWTPKLILEESITDKDYLTTFETVQSFNIKEHKIIRTMLNHFLERIDSEMKREKLDIERLHTEQQKINKTCKQARFSYLSDLKDLKEKTEHDLQILTKRQYEFYQLKEKLTPYVEMSLFQVESIPVEETHLFRMDVKYKTIYELYLSFHSLRNEIQQSLQPFIKSLLKSPLLYELWIFLKIVEQFQHWGFNCQQFIEWIKTKYPNAQKLQGFDEIFQLSDVPFNIRLMYNKEIQAGCQKFKPDFLIGFQKKQQRTWHWYTLDAKYKKYSSQSVKILREDIEHSAVRYYQQIKNELINKIVSSVIIHPTENVSHWNIKQYTDEVHTISHFFVKPNDTSMLKGYFKRLLHHFEGFGQICPTCNKHTEGKVKYVNANILTYKCDNCSEVWVKSSCQNCKKENLYKYATGNFNYQKNDEWNVHCPHCYSDANSSYQTETDILQEVYTRKINDRVIINNPRELVTVNCSRCGGSGYLYQYRHIDGGICYNCNGTGKIQVEQSSVSSTHTSNFIDLNNDLPF